MFKVYLCSRPPLLCLLCLAFLLLGSCSESPTDPNGSVRLWDDLLELEKADLPDSLGPGDILEFRVAVGDSSGGEHTVEVSGVPESMYTIQELPGSAIVRFVLVADDLVADSLYMVQVLVAVGEESRSWDYRFTVAGYPELWMREAQPYGDTLVIAEPRTLSWQAGDSAQFDGFPSLVVLGSFQSRVMVDSIYQGSLTTDAQMLNIQLDLTPEDLHPDSQYTLNFQLIASNGADTLSWGYSVFVKATPDTFSLVYQWSDPGEFPDTLIWGDSLSRWLEMVDTDGKSFGVSVSGIPINMYSITSGEDSVRVSLDIKTGNLKVDSTYVLKILAAGSGPEDSLVFTYPFLVLDTTFRSTLWAESSGDTLGDFLYYGDSLRTTLTMGDSAGEDVSVELFGMDSTRVEREPGNPYKLHLTWVGNDYPADSTYGVTVVLRNADGTNTLEVPFRFSVVDTSLPDAFSLWIASGDSGGFPDTLLYGNTYVREFFYGDTGGKPVTARIIGLPENLTPVSDTLGDTIRLTLSVPADSLDFDSSYSLGLELRGSGAEDTLTRFETFWVRDTSRFGGLKKLTPGLYWREIQYETRTHVKDSANIILSNRETIEHRKYSEVVEVVEQPGALIYTILKRDTLVGKDSVETRREFIKHSDSAAQLLVPQDVGFLDTLFVTFFKLPIRVGDSWTTTDIRVDTTLRLSNIPFIFRGFYSGQASITHRDQLITGDASYPCYRFRNTEDNQVGLMLDTTVHGPTDSLVPGDTAGFISSQTLADLCLSADFTVSLWQSELETSLDTNYLDQKVVRDTVLRENILTEYYDPRTGLLNFR